MSDKFSGLIVVLDEDLREDDAEPLVHAIRMLRGVSEVRPITSRPGLEHNLRLRICKDVKETVLRALNNEMLE